MDPDLTELEGRLQQFIGRTIGPPVVARDCVTEAAIRQFCDVIGDRNPAYRDAESAVETRHAGVVAPPAMMQSWVLDGPPREGIEKARTEQDRLYDLLSEYGYTSALGTSSEEHYERYLRPGDKVSAETVIESVTGPKKTGLGEGWFITTRTTFRDNADAVVGWIEFRVLKFAPKQSVARESEQPATRDPERPSRIKPPMARDNAWWWQAVEKGRLPIQRCAQCGQLRHPPRPMCDACGSVEFDSIDACGRGSVHSFTVVEHPQFPGYEYPIIVVLIDLAEGERIVSNLIDCAPDDCRIGMPVEVVFETGEDGMVLPLFRPAEASS